MNLRNAIFDEPLSLSLSIAEKNYQFRKKNSYVPLTALSYLSGVHLGVALEHREDAIHDLGAIKVGPLSVRFTGHGSKECP